MRPEATPKNQTKGARRTLRRVYFTTVPLQKDGATLMGELALFCRDTHFLKETETIGTGEATILHYRAPRGFGKKEAGSLFFIGNVPRHVRHSALLLHTFTDTVSYGRCVAPCDGTSPCAFAAKGRADFAFPGHGTYGKRTGDTFGTCSVS